MTLTSFIAYWRGKLRDFGPAQGGNMAITFIAFSFPMIFFIGWAVDYSIGNSAKSSMQGALDATGLTLSKEAQSLSKDQLNDKALKYFLVNFNRPEAKNIKITPTFTDLNNGKYKLSLTGTAQVPTTLTGIWQDYMNIGAETQVIWGYKKLELALALDNTGSMASRGKMDQLKIAAKNLIETLKKTAKKDGDIKISIIPFNTDVNVGTGAVEADWIRWDEWESDNTNYACSNTRYDSRRDCTDHGERWQLKNKSSWNGCVWDRDKDNDVKNTTPDKNIKSTKFSAHQEQNCPVEMMPLSFDWTKLTNKIDAMKPVGNTNVTIGMALAFQTLTPSGPFNAASPSTDLDKVIILLTDGENTENRFGDRTSRIDDRTKLACQNAKSFYSGTQAIKIYSIRVIEGNSSLLQQCATKADMYYDVQDASQLNQVFVNIANSLASLRLSE